ncbi:hypothetical protein ETAA8_51200 [Anatilimnocola aggregata]|uniref:CopZ zinc binding domain-containing protein n=1 Tax=Anatilimnocola aggregata TaxID=2528021 RepID=A0A517YIG2_9BACT|nr:hypothetical protein [Anatilimnocola aggregata]QDU30002.1 hypothetical protein ETAA8_51200 [Anatilimnocola aggregata]
MNKAFTREPDADDVLCPKCGASGDAVPEAAVSSYVSAELRKKLSDTVYFCSTTSCPVAYFDAMEGAIEAAALNQPIYPKDPAAPICGCFGFKLEDIEDDAAEAVPRRIRELLAKSKSPAAHCSSAAPNGRCCLPEVQRLYFRLKSQASRG